MGKDNKVNFQKLTPYDKLDLGIYKDAIDFIFQNKDLNNIAITGSYGSGKSSIIESYKNLYCNSNEYKNSESDEKLKNKKEFIHISLAEITSNKEIGQNNINELEGKIINSLIQQINPNNIPHSSFQRIIDTNKRVTKNRISFVSLFVLSNFTLFNKKLMQDIFFMPAFFKDIGIESDDIFIINFLIWLFMMVILVSCLLNYLTKRPLLKRIKILNNEIELFETENEDYFNKYLNEIIYLFKNCGVDAIVFEDIDRFNMKEIFIKLREINFLTNRQLLNEGENPLKFIYLLRDDLFDTKERTKFFDYIIPIIPIADASNSADYIIDLFKDKNYFKSNDEKLFLKEISLYIDDMRVIKNIYNEFEIYRKKIGEILQLDHKKLFAVIVYKNIFPNDFNKFQYNNGYVYSVLQEKKIKQQELIFENEKKINQLWDEYYKSHEPIDETDSDSTYEEHDYYYSYSEGIWEEIESESNKRKYFVDISLQELIQYKKLNLLEEDLNGTSSLKEDYVNNIKNNVYFSLLKFLLLNGYLNEFTKEYISYFKEGLLSLQDKKFIKDVKNKTNGDYGYRLKNIEIILTWIRPYEYEHESILNYDLFKYLLENKIESNELKVIIKQIKESNNQEFIVKFLLIDELTDINKYLTLVAEIYPDFIFDIYSKINSDICKKNKGHLELLLIHIISLLAPVMLNSENIKEDYSDVFLEKLSDKSIDTIQNIINDPYNYGLSGKYIKQKLKNYKQTNLNQIFKLAK